MVKERTLEEVHDKYVGHSKFARFCDYAIANGYEITQIKEHQSKFKFRMNGYLVEFDKSPDLNFMAQFRMCEKVIMYHKELEELKL